MCRKTQTFQQVYRHPFRRHCIRIRGLACWHGECFINLVMLAGVLAPSPRRFTPPWFPRALKRPTEQSEPDCRLSFFVLAPVRAYHARTMTASASGNPCIVCGACCAAFRVDFDPAECDDVPGGRVPQALADRLGETLCRMIGTDRLPPRCLALSGSVGGPVRCGIYEQRPSPCREFEAGADACIRARRVHGLGAID